MTPYRILLADDHKVFLECLRSFLTERGFEVIGEAEDGHDAIRLAGDLHPDIAILDIAMPGLNGVDACRVIRRNLPDVIVILLTEHSEEKYVVEGLRAGASGYVLKTQEATDLVQAVMETARGGLYLSPGVSRVVVEGCLTDGAPAPKPLTPREREVLQLVAEGKTTKEIGVILGLSTKTAESHRVRVMKKLEIHSTAGLVHYAIRQGIVEL